jgi:hypothetical protein
MRLLFQDKNRVGLLFCLMPDARSLHHRAHDNVLFWLHSGRSSFEVFADRPLGKSVVLIFGITEETRCYH